MTNVKYCPIMSYQKQYHDEMYCMKNDCAFWDEERKQCCIKTMALANKPIIVNRQGEIKLRPPHVEK